MWESDPDMCPTDAAEASILKIFLDKEAPKRVRLIDHTDLPRTWISSNENTTKAGPTYRPYGPDAGLT